jgi:small subunit ribosomal protein S6
MTEGGALKTYQGLFILPSTLKDERVAELAEIIKGEIAKLQGRVLNAAPVEKRMFARPMQKMEAGYYLRMQFQMDPASVAPFQARLRLMDDVFRTQVVSLKEGDLSSAGAPAAAAAAKAPETPKAPPGQGETHA